MLRVMSLYRPFRTKETYKGIKEEAILSTLYEYQSESLEVIVAHIIHQAVLDHMNLAIDSTLMQMLALNDHLTHLFISNLEALTFNYGLKYLEDRAIEEIDEGTMKKLETLAQKVHMKTEFLHLNLELEEVYKAII